MAEMAVTTRSIMVALRLYPPIMAIGTVGGVALAEGSLAIAMSEVTDVALDAIACRSKPERSRGRPRD